MTNNEIAVLNKIKSNFTASEIRSVSVRDTDNKANIIFGDKSEESRIRHNSVYSLRRKKSAIIEAQTEYSLKCAQYRIYPDTRLFPQGEMRCGKIVICNIDDIEEVFDSDNTCAMTRDGVFFICANSINEAYKQLEIANLIASICCNARSLERELCVLDSRHIALYKLNVTLPLLEELDKEEIEGEREAREALAEAISALYKENLFLDSNGAASCKISDTAFLITASDKERSSVTSDDIVLIHKGRREPGKRPSNSAALHKLIYDTNPDINAIIISHPHYSMAYAACYCDISLDTQAKELVQSLKRYPFGTTVMQPRLFARGIEGSSGAFLIENDCLICYGRNMQEAILVTREIERCAKQLTTK